jgi:predicted nucleic acid-binding protein
VAKLPEVVVDASAVCKWFIPETDSSAAIALRDAHVGGRIRLLAPDLLSYEVANALRHHPGMSGDRLRSAVRSLFDLQVNLVVPSPALMG